MEKQKYFSSCIMSQIATACKDTEDLQRLDFF